MTEGPVLDHGGMPDRWQRLWTPHREAYLRGESRPAHDGPGDECPFCRAPGLPEGEGLVVARGDVAYVVMNLYPYNAGPPADRRGHRVRVAASAQGIQHRSQGRAPLPSACVAGHKRSSGEAGLLRHLG